MSTITIRDVPPAVHRSLTSRARAHGRSLNKEIIVTLESILHGAAIDAKAVGTHQVEEQGVLEVGHRARLAEDAEIAVRDTPEDAPVLAPLACPQ